MGNYSSLQKDEEIVPIVDLSLYECNICYEYMLPPYFQCFNGHIFCNSCLAKITCCSACKGHKPYIRNRVMEAIIEPRLNQCQYKDCERKFLNMEFKLDHENECEYKPNNVSCQYLCQWKGAINELVSHLVSEHDCPVDQGSTINNRYRTISDSTLYYSNIQDCFGSKFLVTLVRNRRYVCVEFYFVVQLIGNRKNAKKFTYSAIIRNEFNEIAYKLDVKSIMENINEIIAKEDCFLFSEKQATKFAKGGKLPMFIQIQQK